MEIREVQGEVEVTTTLGTRNGVPVIVQTKTITVVETVGDVRRREVKTVETEQPLLPLLRREAARRAAQQLQINDECGVVSRELIDRLRKSGVAAFSLPRVLLTGAAY